MISIEDAKNKLSLYFNSIDDSIEIIGEHSWRLRINPDTYSPKLDIAVGPFALDNRIEGGYDGFINKSSDFLNKCINKFKENIERNDMSFEIPSVSDFVGTNAFNYNARCLIAVEFESGKMSEKHMLGSSLNAISLGRVAILVGINDNAVRKFLRALKYLKFLKSVGKPTFEFNNAIILSNEQFEVILGNL